MRVPAAVVSTPSGVPGPFVSKSRLGEVVGDVVKMPEPSSKPWPKRMGPFWPGKAAFAAGAETPSAAAAVAARMKLRCKGDLRIGVITAILSAAPGPHIGVSPRTGPRYPDDP